MPRFIKRLFVIANAIIPIIDYAFKLKKTDLAYQAWREFKEGGVEGLDVDDGLDDDAVQKYLRLSTDLGNKPLLWLMQLMADAQIIKNIHGQTSANRMKPFYYNNNHFINMVVLFWGQLFGQAGKDK